VTKLTEPQEVRGVDVLEKFADPRELVVAVVEFPDPAEYFVPILV